MRSNQTLLVIGLVVAVAAVGIAVVTFRSANAHRDIMLDALQRGMERAYDQAVARTPHPNSGQPVVLSASGLRTLLGGKEQSSILPTFIDPRDIFLPRESVLIPSDEFVCVVRFNNAHLFGITGKRTWREVSPDEFANWPHESMDAMRGQ